MECDRIVFSGHAVQRMFEREIRVQDVEHAIATGEVISDYPDDTPFPSCLILALVDGRPVHIVAAEDEVTRTCYVVTVYNPDPALWDPAFKRRRPS